ncbi:MAG: hypothetical protein RIS79_397, partial [Verrucomicrobiota bacterium]
MKAPRLLMPTFWVLLAAAVGTSAHDATPKLIQNPRVLDSSTVRHADGGTTTYQRIEPPTAAQLAALNPPVQAPTTPAVPLPPILNLTARVYDGVLTEVKWLHNGVECRAWSSVDFRLLEAIPQFEQDGITRRLMSITTTQRQPPAGVVSQRVWPAFPAEVLAAAGGKAGGGDLRQSGAAHGASGRRHGGPLPHLDDEPAGAG